jgi:glycosyltransferase involved in cell wall biosynthesis
MKHRLAYLNSRYPSLSHTFIEREIRFLRELDVEVRTCSIRPPTANDLLGATNRKSSEETFYLLKSASGLLLRAVAGALRHPLRAVRAFWQGQRLSPPGWRERVKHVAYALEGIVLARHLASQGIRHVHVHMANNGASVALLAGRFDPRLDYSLSIHGSAEFFNVPGVRLREKVEGARFVRCVSNFCRAQVMAWSSPEAWPRLHVARCGIDPTRFRLSAQEAGGPVRLAAIGRFEPIKGYALLLEACAGLGARGVDWRLELIGDGPLRGALERQARDLGIEPRVRFAGAVAPDDLPSLLERSHLLVVSSFMEGLPIVLMEAMASGLPVVSTRVAGVTELVEEGVTGFLAQPGSVEELQRALELAVSGRTRFGQMGRAARGRIERDFDIRRTAREMRDLFDRHLGETPRA